MDPELPAGHRVHHLRVEHQVPHVGAGQHDALLAGEPAGPAEAVEAFLPDRDDFVVAPIGEKFFLTFNPGGVLQRAH